MAIAKFLSCQAPYRLSGWLTNLGKAQRPLIKFTSASACWLALLLFSTYAYSAAPYTWYEVIGVGGSTVIRTDPQSVSCIGTKAPSKGEMNSMFFDCAPASVYWASYDVTLYKTSMDSCDTPQYTCIVNYTGGEYLCGTYSETLLCWDGSQPIDGTCEDPPPPPEKNRGLCEGESCCLGNPINAGTGNKYQRENDVHLTRLGFSRVYNSVDFQLNGEPVSTVVGRHWNHSFERNLIEDATNLDDIHAIRPDGKGYVFSWSGNQWVPDADVRDQLEQLTDPQGSTTGWLYTTAGNRVEAYDANGVLQSITNVLGTTQTLTCNATSGLLERVDTNTGEFLVFSYNADDRISAVTDHAGRSWGYG